MRIAVIGAGAMGRWAVKELAISPEVAAIVVGDYDEQQAQAVAAAQGGGKATIGPEQFRCFDKGHIGVGREGRRSRWSAR